MKFAPRHNWIVGRLVIKKKQTSIIRPTEEKVTKFVLVDAVGEEAEAAGVKVGDLIVPTALDNVVVDGGFRPVLEEKAVGFFVTDVTTEELLVQTDKGNEFVPFDSEKAAKPLGAPARTVQSSEAAA